MPPSPEVIFSPKTVRFLCLSATIPNCDELAHWIESVIDHHVKVISHHHRAVPLTFQFYYQKKLLDFKELKKKVRGGADNPRFIKGAKGKKNEDEFRHFDIIKMLRTQDKLPLLYFVFSRALADKFSKDVAKKMNFTTAEGGASVWRDIPGIDNDEIYKWFQLYSLHGQNKDALAKSQLGSWEYDIIAPLYKCNMTDIMASIGLRQLDRYQDLLQRREVIINEYDMMCDSLGLEHIKHSGEDYKSCGHLYIVRIPGISDEQRRAVIVKMAEQGISCNVHYKPLPMMTAYKSCDHVKGGGVDIKDFPNAYHLYENEITLPLHTLLSDEDVKYIVYWFTKIVQGL